MLGRPDAGDWAHRSLSLYEAVGDLDGQANLANNLGVQAYFEGRWSETLELYGRSRDAYLRIGERHRRRGDGRQHRRGARQPGPTR